MKILEAERSLKSTNPHEVVLLQQQREEGDTGAPHLEARKVERRDECEKCEGMATARGIDPFLKADIPTRAPKHHGQSLPRHAPGFPPYDTGARSHMSYKLTRNAKMANRRKRSMQPHRGCAPFQLRCNRRSSMEAWAHMSCNRRVGYHVQNNRTATCAKAASSRGYRTSATTRGSPAHDPTVPIKCDGHGSVSRGNRHDS
jgi:hypothetical protein